MVSNETTSRAYINRSTKETLGFPSNMTPEQIAAGKRHIEKVWWPQLCRSSRTNKRMIDAGVFQPGWYDSNDLLDVSHPAYWRIINALGNFYGMIQREYKGEDISKFSVRWQVDKKHAVVLKLEYRKNGGITEVPQVFRVKGTGAGWVDHQMEIDVLRAMRDARDVDQRPISSDSTVMPAMTIDKHGGLVHTAIHRPDIGGPKFSRAQKEDIAKQVSDALRSSTTSKRTHPSIISFSSDGETTSGKVAEWMNKRADPEDQDPFVDHPSVQWLNTSTVEGPSADQEVLDKKMRFTPEEWDPSVDDPSIVKTTAALARMILDPSEVPGMEDDEKNLTTNNQATLLSKTISRAGSPPPQGPILELSNIEDDTEPWTVLDAAYIESLAEPMDDEISPARRGWFRSWFS